MGDLSPVNRKGGHLPHFLQPLAAGRNGANDLGVVTALSLTSSRRRSRSISPMRGIVPQDGKMSEGDLSPVDSGGVVPQTSSAMSIPDFIARCDAYCEARGVTRVWLSKRLFADTYRLKELAEGNADVGVKRLERAVADLEEMEKSPAASDEAA